MIVTLQERHKDEQKPKIKTYIYKCSCCDSLIQFDNTDIIDEWYWGDNEHYIWCPVCKHKIILWWLWRWLHRVKFYKIFHKMN